MSPPRPSSPCAVHQLLRARLRPALGRERLARRAVADELDGAHEPATAADVADDRVPVELERAARRGSRPCTRALSTSPSRSMMSSVASPAAHAAGLPPNVKRWLKAECSPMNVVGHVLGRDRRADRRVAAGQALGDRGDVRHDAPVLGGEHRPGAAEAGDHLVEDQQDPVAVADPADRRPVERVRRVDAGGGRDRLADHGGDGLRALVEDRALDLARALEVGRATGRYSSGPWTRTAPGSSGPYSTPVLEPPPPRLRHASVAPW